MFRHLNICKKIRSCATPFVRGCKIKKAIVRLRIFLSRIYPSRLQPAKYVYLCRKKCLSGINYQGNKIKYKMENILICFEIYQAEPILIERTRHSHRPNVMFSLGTASSERGVETRMNKFFKELGMPENENN